MKSFRLFCLVALFCVDVRVHAGGAGRVNHTGTVGTTSEDHKESGGGKGRVNHAAARAAQAAADVAAAAAKAAANVLEKDSIHNIEAAKSESCWGVKLPCAIYANGGRRELESSGLKLVLGPGALIEMRSADKLHVVSGSVYVETEVALKFTTPYGNFYCADECSALIHRRQTVLKLKSLSGPWRYQRLGESAEYALNPGLQIWLSEVSASGQAVVDFPQSLPWDSTVKAWAALFPGEPEEFKQSLVKFRKVWRAAVEEVSLIHQEAAQRNIASDLKEKNQAAAKARIKEQEDQRLRDEFRLKTLGQ